MILEAVIPFRSRHVTFKFAADAWEFRAYWRMRQRIFCQEQGLFEGSDRDAVDETAIPIVAVGWIAGMPEDVVGVVRVWRQARGEWWGGRLGTHPDHRGDRTIAPGLIRLAVGTACRRGCTRFCATVQMRNVALFERLNWRVVGETQVCGRAHALMEADLARYGGASA
jgi:putative N-acetyltransferase (TIGR04045 family)